MWIIEFLADLLGIAVIDQVVERMPAWGCALAIAIVAMLVVVAVWLI